MTWFGRKHSSSEADKAHGAAPPQGFRQTPEEQAETRRHMEAELEAQRAKRAATKGTHAA